MWAKQAGKAIRSLGQTIDRVGVSLEGKLTYTEHCNESLDACREEPGTLAQVRGGRVCGPNASVIGDVKVGKGSSIWYNATVRGDVNYITIGENTNIQDQAVVHVAKIHKDIPTKIGSNVTVGPAAIVHACTIQDHCIIGTGAQVLDGAVVGAKSIITAGSIVTKGKQVPSGQLWSGVPARYLRDLTAEEMQFMQQCSAEYTQLAEQHAEECAKTFEEYEADTERFKILRDVGETGLPQKGDEREDTGLFFRY
ncbi:Trimeric LpxA-like [Phytophthora cactorum]|nr:Trimeric LpxA-like [Phytophthora cactorum]